MGRIVRVISEDGSVVCSAIDGTDIANTIERIHQPSAVVTAALGRLAMGASLIGYGLKSEDDSLTVRIDGGGPAGRLVAVSDSRGNVKCCADEYIIELALKSNGKLDVGSAVGSSGTITVIKDLGLKEPYIGQTGLISGEIAEDITGYFAQSEQIPTVCALGVLVNPDLSVKRAGGYLIQLLPFAPESAIDCLERSIATLPSVTTMLDMGMSPKDIAERAMEGLSPQPLDGCEVSYLCDCSRERTLKILASLSPDDLRELSRDKSTEVVCHFCKTASSFSREEIISLLERKLAK